MHLGRFKDHSLWIKLLIWLGWMAAGGVLFMLITSILIASGVDMQNAHVMRGILMWQNVFIFVIPALLAVCMWSTRPCQWLHIDRPVSGWIPAACALLMIIALPGNNLLAWLNQQIILPECLQGVAEWMKNQEEASERVLNMLLQDGRWSSFLLNFAVIAILAAIGEEFCFRGVMQGLMQHTTRAIWITAILFSAIHMQFYGFIPRMLMGALFGYMLVWTGNLWIPIIMHCTNNGMIAILYYIAQVRGMDTKQMDAFGTEDTLWAGILSLVLVIAGIYILRRSLTISSASSRTSKGS